jgi:hypothetical protein
MDRKFTALEMNVYLAISVYNEVVQSMRGGVAGAAQLAGKTAVGAIFTSSTVPSKTTIEATEPYKSLISTSVETSVA